MKFTLLLLLLLFLLPVVSSAQPRFILQVNPVLYNHNIILKEPSGLRDSLTFQQLRFYLGRFTFFQNGMPTFEDNNYHLLDLEDETTLTLLFRIPENTSFDSLSFQLGVDSITTASGVMSGDLDPTKGMFWAWQSGYINAKIEGVSPKSPAPDGAFRFHLGGYLAPYQASQQVGIKLPAPVEGRLLNLLLDLTPFFEQVDWKDKHNLMSPGAEAVRLSGILGKSFRIHAP